MIYHLFFSETRSQRLISGSPLKLSQKAQELKAHTSVHGSHDI